MLKYLVLPWPGFSQTKLANLIGMNESALSLILRGNLEALAYSRAGDSSYIGNYRGSLFPVRDF